MSDIEEGTPTNNGQQKERRKIEIKFIENKTRRHVTFSKRKHGIMKKAFELSVLTGTQVLLLVVSETGLVYTFSTPKFEPIVTQQEGRNLIQACLNAPDDEEEDEEEDGDDDDDDDDDGNDMQRQQPQQQQPQQQQQVLNAHANSLGHLNQDQVPAGALKQEVKSQLLGGKSGSDKKANEDIDADTESEARDREQSEEEDIEDFGESEANPEKFIIYTPVLKFRKNDTLKSTYCVKFFCDDSYIWVKPTDMKILTSEDCRQWLSGKQRKNKKLIPAYEMAMRGKNGIDIWEFVEYGSYGKADEEEYVEEEEEENEPEKKAIRPTRSSSRQRQKRASETEKSEGGNSNKRKRVTRSTRQQAINASEEEEEEKVQGAVRKRPQRTKTKKVVVSKTKPNPKTKAKKEKPKPPKPIKYHFEDDEDWSIVGLGPQDLSIEKTMDPIAKKLSQKKNLEKHVEIKLDLEDKLAGINKLLCDVLCSAINQAVSIKDDFEIILDEIVKIVLSLM
ncbi:XXYS1_4_G0025290.mRNA.1.CDS.1 [Saccharomyces cerevisiae]|nr:XXYS1_4_G0025290.mRNA.1.CDS.1 [Saccharomyces cerevisiae]